MDITIIEAIRSCQADKYVKKESALADANSPQTVIPSNLQNSSTSSLKYPSNIGNAPFYTRISLRKYSRNRPDSGYKEDITATLILPIPENFGDSQSPLWQGYELGLLGASLSELQEAKASLARTGNSIFDQYMRGDTVGALKDAAMAAGTIAAAVSPRSMRDGNIQTRASQQFGIVVNPHLSLAFQGMALRNHELRWKFAPRNAGEAAQLGSIIRTIRINTLPSYDPTVSKFALQYPNTMEVQFFGIDQDFKTPIFKSAVTGLSTNLGPSGLAFFPKGVPVEIELAISLTETEIVTQEDFKSNTTQQQQ